MINHEKTQIYKSHVCGHNAAAMLWKNGGWKNYLAVGGFTVYLVPLLQSIPTATRRYHNQIPEPRLLERIPTRAEIFIL